MDSQTSPSILSAERETMQTISHLCWVNLRLELTSKGSAWVAHSCWLLPSLVASPLQQQLASLIASSSFLSVLYSKTQSSHLLSLQRHQTWFHRFSPLNISALRTSASPICFLSHRRNNYLFELLCWYYIVLWFEHQMSPQAQTLVNT